MRFFTDEEIERLRSWSAELGRDELIRFFTLGSDDRAWIDATTSGATNKLGLGIQLCTLPWLGFVPDDVPSAPAAAVNRIAVQLGLRMGNLSGYGEREQTRTEHLRAVATRLGWRPAKGPEWKDLEEFLLARALEHDVPSVLLRLACEYLYGARIIRPGVVPLARTVASARERAVAETFLRVQPLLGEAGCRGFWTGLRR